MISVAHPSLNDVLSSDNIPSLPEVAVRIIEAAQQPDPDPVDLVKAIRADPATAGRVLMFANSALFGMRAQSPSIELAVPMLGTTLTRTIVLGFYLSNHSCNDRELQSWSRRLWRESLFNASAAELLAEKIKEADPPTWFLAGLLQDVGQLAMLNAIGRSYIEEVLEGDPESRRIDREKKAFGFTHVDVSTALCKTWNLDAEIVSSVEQHHNHPSSCANAVTPEIVSGLITAACCSEYIDGIGSQLNATRRDVEHLMLEKFQLLPNDVYPTLVEMDSRAVELAVGFSIDAGDLPPREALLKRAQVALRRVAKERKLGQLGVLPCNDQTQPCEWSDKSTSAYNRRFLDKVLPEELKNSHAESTTIGLLEVNVKVIDEAKWGRQQAEFISIITDCVRPDDCVIRTGDSTAVVILQRLNVSSLQRIAGRLRDSLIEHLELVDTEDGSTTVGGVIVVPVGRKAATPKIVVDTLNESVAAATVSESAGIAFRILTGKKAVSASKS